MMTEFTSVPATSDPVDVVAEARQVLGSARQIYTKAQIESAMDRLAGQLSERLSGKHPLVLCVMQGGLMFTAGMLPRLNLMTELDYIHASRYRNRTSGHELDWLAYPKTPLKDRTVLILDDIFDKGHTLAALENYCRQQGASEVVSAVLLFKHCNQQTLETRCEYAALDVEDRYIFGYGMDYKGQLRQLDCIYTIDEQE
jgi:hypoxanthine phosphoribosyltransferase